eukprot:scaffold28640_cov75-Phaeocystis_antarctica.AAC.1
MVWQRGQRVLRAVHAGKATRAHDLRKVAGGGLQLQAVRQRAAAWRLAWPHGAAPRPHGSLHSARSPPLVLAPPPPRALPPRARLRRPQPGPAPPPSQPPPAEPRRPPSPPPVARWQLARAALAPWARTLHCCRRQWPSPWVQAWPSSSCPCPSLPPSPSPPPPLPAAPPPSRRPWSQRAPPRRPPWPPSQPPAARRAAAAAALTALLRCASPARPL